MTEFKQIIAGNFVSGDDCGKLYSISGLHWSRHTVFADPEFDGDPAFIEDSEINEDGETNEYNHHGTEQPIENCLTSINPEGTRRAGWPDHHH